MSTYIEKLDSLVETLHMDRKTQRRRYREMASPAAMSIILDFLNSTKARLEGARLGGRVNSNASKAFLRDIVEAQHDTIMETLIAFEDMEFRLDMTRSARHK